MSTKKTTEEWEKEFDEYFDYYIHSEEWITDKDLSIFWGIKEGLKSFIRTQIQKARQEERAKLKKILEGLRITFDEANKEAIEPDDYMFGFEKCKKKITKALKEL